MNEVEKLRGLLTRCDEYLAEKGVIRDAKLRREIRTVLSQQAEPVPAQYSDVVSNGGMDPRNEPVQAQDERDLGLERQAFDQCFIYTEERFEIWLAAKNHERVNRPAQTEQQPAECTNEDSWNCKYCRKTEECQAIKDPRNFGAPIAQTANRGEPESDDRE